MPQPIDSRGVDPGEAAVQRALNGADGLSVILRAPCELPIAAANRPGAVTDGGELKVRIAKSTRRKRSRRSSRRHGVSMQTPWLRLQNGCIMARSKTCLRA